jgi:hypothetical protein
MSDFAQLKKNRSDSFQKLTAAAEKVNNTTSENSRGDDRFWKPTVDKAGNGSAIIRFLPAPTGEDVPFVRYWDHGFQGPGGWYIEKSLTTLNEDDPVAELNRKLWNSGIDADKEVARKQKRRLHYISNIYVVQDSGNPDNDGKVFLYQYGKKIFDKINDLMHPQFEDEEAVNPFDFWEGANFRLRIRNVEGYRNYDKSQFDSPSALADDEQMEKLWSMEHSLQELVDRKNFKSYDELKARLMKVLGSVTPATQAATSEIEEAPWSPPSAAAPEVASVETSISDDDDDSLEFFRKLANDD